MTRRRGFTLWEMTIVLALVALGAALVVPSWVDFGENPTTGPGDPLIALLRDARKLAIEQSQTVSVRIDPSTLYRKLSRYGVEA
jgi:prepilin-type N-terminal cleavage/methylation domain-containing protein